jgi:hypothetical protein
MRVHDGITLKVSAHTGNLTCLFLGSGEVEKVIVAPEQRCEMRVHRHLLIADRISGYRKNESFALCVVEAGTWGQSGENFDWGPVWYRPIQLLDLRICDSEATDRPIKNQVDSAYPPEPIPDSVDHYVTARRVSGLAGARYVRWRGV